MLSLKLSQRQVSDLVDTELHLVSDVPFAAISVKQRTFARCLPLFPFLQLLDSFADCLSGLLLLVAADSLKMIKLLAVEHQLISLLNE